MSVYEVRQCEDSPLEKWCIYVNGARDHSLGEFGTRGEAEAIVCQLILRNKILAKNPSAQFEIPVPVQKRSYIGPVIVIVDSLKGFGYGAAQSLGMGKYALHTGKAFSAVKENAESITVTYRDTGVKIEPPKPRGRDGHGR